MRRSRAGIGICLGDVVDAGRVELYGDFFAGRWGAGEVQVGAADGEDAGCPAAWVAGEKRHCVTG